jgi:hypothetical protein
MKPSNPPSKHHFIPEFLIREWAGSDGKVERFVRVPGGRVHARRVAPSAIGFEKDLYLNTHVSDPWKSQALETDFFSPLDNLAAKTMQTMLRGEHISDGDMRSAWASFLMSLFHRSPTDLDATKTAIAEMLAQEDPEVEARYRLKRKPEHPETFVEYMEKADPAFADRVSANIVPGLILNENIGNFIINCHWQVLDLSCANVTLLLSDLPIMFTPLKNPGGHLGLVIGPSRIFVASTDVSFLEELKKISATNIAKQANRLAVGRARHFVIGADQKQLPFIEKHLGTIEIASLALGFEPFAS